MNTITPSRQTYDKIRAGFIAQGSSLNQFCRQIGLLRQNAYRACLGLWKGPQGQQTLTELYAASQGLTTKDFSEKNADGRRFCND